MVSRVWRVLLAPTSKSCLPVAFRGATPISLARGWPTVPCAPFPKPANPGWQSDESLDRLPDDLAACTGLRSLKILGSELEELPPWLAGFSRLHTLDVSGCAARGCGDGPGLLGFAQAHT